uniref:Uncharacterized protein n=1 Tax=Lutzomyia longipalpis TaxID=7200 RepID=A0A240SXQ0_LUTLO
MLVKYHRELKKIILFFFKVWRLDFLPGSDWRIIGFLKLSAFPVLLVMGWIFAYWHIVYEMKDFSNFLDVAFTITFVIAYYQVLMVYLSINVFNRDGVIKILAYFDHLVTDRKCEISEIRQRIFSGILKNALLFSRMFINRIGFSWLPC